MADPPSPPPRRPAVWVNCAASADGRLAFAGGVRARLSSQDDLVRVQRLRANADAILVGVGTVVRDDPTLRVHWDLLGERPGKDPTRVVVDGSGRTPEAAKVLDGKAPTIVATSESSKRVFPPSVRTVVAGRDRVDLPVLFPKLYELGVRRLMVEGGSEVLSSVLRARLFDRCSIYYAPVVIGSADAPPIVAGPAARSPEETVGLQLVSLERVGEGYVVTYIPGRAPGPDASPPATA